MLKFEVSSQFLLEFPLSRVSHQPPGQCPKQPAEVRGPVPGQTPEPEPEPERSVDIVRVTQEPSQLQTVTETTLASDQT